jgi:hypothetical protein
MDHNVCIALKINCSLLPLFQMPISLGFPNGYFFMKIAKSKSVNELVIALIPAGWQQ